jgi:hypothetical protein
VRLRRKEKLGASICEFKTKSAGFHQSTVYLGLYSMHINRFYNDLMAYPPSPSPSPTPLHSFSMDILYILDLFEENGIYSGNFLPQKYKAIASREFPRKEIMPTENIVFFFLFLKNCLYFLRINIW